MSGGFHPFQDSFYLPVGPDEVGGPLGTHGFSPINGFLGPDLIGFHNLLIRVAQ